jgi:hypothetical protein
LLQQVLQLLFKQQVVVEVLLLETHMGKMVLFLVVLVVEVVLAHHKELVLLETHLL